MEATKIEVIYPYAFRRSVDRVQVSHEFKAKTIWLNDKGLITGFEPVTVILTYIEPPEEIHGYYYPNQDSGDYLP